MSSEEELREEVFNLLWVFNGLTYSDIVEMSPQDRQWLRKRAGREMRKELKGKVTIWG
ncbi:hypothetical protein LCGC14_0874990 [marine sediment metagenome]|uniref:Uncharacterized protein n=1 Tax=marine sediment metagenome TaxID=412755 RepID=A0A0F9RNA0_9ZZZZ